MSKRTKPVYSLDFKQSSVKLAIESDQPISKTAKDLGINESTLYNWVCKFGSTERKESKSGSEMEEELKALRRENSRLKQERDILKKAAAYFANEIA
jgi:transposase